ncbi:MAG: hypothetical protein KatS3mg061_3020 [Dehalococcoidia bacterium]|nr:MAG: hypothetical protein KatS3mg061_3020 [Dehalococcoidia bacterium]
MSTELVAAEEAPRSPEAERLYRIRHSAAHVMAQAVLELFPEAELAIGPPIEDGFYYDFLLPRALTPDDLQEIEARMRRIIAGNHPFLLSWMSREGSDRLLPPAPPALQGRDPRRASRERPSGRQGLLLHPGYLYRPLPGAARRAYRPDWRLQADERRWRLLAGRREAADAAADLWHRLGDCGAARCLPASTRGSGAARPPSARARARAVHHQRRGRPRAHPLASQGSARAGHHGSLLARSPRGPRLSIRLHPARRASGPLADLRPPRVLPREHVPPRWRSRSRSTTSSR